MFEIIKTYCVTKLKACFLAISRDRDGWQRHTSGGGCTHPNRKKCGQNSDKIRAKVGRI